MRKLKVLMKKGMVALVIAAVTIQITGCDIMKDAPVIGNFVGLKSNEAFVIEDNICLVDEVKLVYMNLQNQYKEDFGGTVDWSQQIDGQTFDKYILNMVKSEMSVVYAMSAIAKEKGINITGDEDAMLDEAVDEYFSELSQQEKEYASVTKDTIKSVYRNYYLADKVYMKETDGISSSISDEEARVIKVQRIFIDTSTTDEATAQETLKQVKKQVENGYQDFLVQANKYSEKEVEIKLMKNQATKEYESAAFELGEGELSEVITEEDGVYLVKCISTYLEKETQANKDEIILNTKVNAFNSIYKKYVNEASYDINDKAWSQIKASDNDLIITNNLFDVYDKCLDDNK